MTLEILTKVRNAERRGVRLHSEPLKKALSRIFPPDEERFEVMSYAEEDIWREETFDIVLTVLSAFARGHYSETGIDVNDGAAYREAFAVVTGGVARLWHRDSHMYHKIGSLLRRTACLFAQEKPEGCDPLYEEAISDFEVGPNDIDVKIITSQPQFTIKHLRDELNALSTILLTRLEKTDTKSTYELSPFRSQDNARGRLIISSSSIPNKPLMQAVITHPDDGPTKIDLTHISNDWMNDFRLGPNQSSKQNSYAVLINDLYDRSDIMIANDVHGYAQEMLTMYKPSRTDECVYSSFSQCVLAGLRLIRNELLFPADNSDEGIHAYQTVDKKESIAWKGIDLHTIEAYRAQLESLYAPFQQGADRADLYRVREIIREGILCLNINTDDALLYMSALGLLDIFMPGHGMNDVVHTWEPSTSDQYPLLNTIHTEGQAWHRIMNKLARNEIIVADIRFASDDIPATAVVQAGAAHGIVQPISQHNLVNLAYTFDMRRLQQPQSDQKGTA